MTTERSAIQRFGKELAGKGPGAATLVKLAGLALVLVPLPGCQSITGNPTLSNVRVIDASPDAPGMDVYLDASVLVYDIGFGTITSYDPIAPGSYSVNADLAGTKTQLVTAGGTFLANKQYTVLIGNYAAALQESVLTDQSIPAPSNYFALRIIDQSVRTGPLDIYLVPSGSTLAQSKPYATGVTFNNINGYGNVSTLPTSTYTLVVVPANTVITSTTATLYTGAAVTYTGGSAQTLVLIDTQLTTSPAIQVVTANDYSPTS